MISIKSLSVKVGDLVIPAWRRLVEYIAGLEVWPGVGVLLTKGPRGTVVNSRSALLGFSGSWAVGLSGETAAIGTGYINGAMPTIDGKPMTEKKLLLKAKTFDKEGRSWICLEAEVGDEGQIIKENPFRLVQAAHPYFTEDPKIGRAPLAVMVRKGNTGFGEVHRIAYFDLQHRYDQGKKRHFFFV